MSVRIMDATYTVADQPGQGGSQKVAWREHPRGQNPDKWAGGMALKLAALAVLASLANSAPYDRARLTP
jgi:hypothetical protein